MNRLKKVALLTKLIQVLSENMSWCGETHIQKAAFFLQKLLYVPFEFDFILYKYGPFSFDLRDELTSMRADGLLNLEPCLSYGSRFSTTANCKYIQNQFPITLSKYNDAINWVGGKLGSKGVVELERLATALFIGQEMKKDAVSNEKAEILIKLKPHVSLENANEAINTVEQYISEIRETNLK